MQVQRVQNNTQPHFTSIEFIAKGVPKEKMTTHFLDICANAKRRLAGALEDEFVKVQVVVDGKNLTPRIITGFADNYSGFFKASTDKINPEFMHVETMKHRFSDDSWRNGVRDVAVYKFPSAAEAEAACERINQAPTTIEKAVEFAKIVHDSVIRSFENARSAADIKARNQVRALQIFDKIC